MRRIQAFTAAVIVVLSIGAAASSAAAHDNGGYDRKSHPVGDTTTTVPSVVPPITVSHSSPTCTCDQYTITVKAGGGNVSTYVEIVSSPAWVLKSGDINPNGKLSYSNSLKPGEYVDITVLQDSQQVDAFRITAPSNETCHPATTTVPSSTTSTTATPVSTPEGPPITVIPSPTTTTSIDIGTAISTVAPRPLPNNGTLPVTGSAAAFFGKFGAALLLIGLALRGVRRRRLF